MLFTKVGRLLKPTKNVLETMWKNSAPFEYEYDYSAGAVRPALEDSLQRLGISSIDFAFIHNLSPDHKPEYKTGITWEDHFENPSKGAMLELEKMKEEGLTFYSFQKMSGKKRSLQDFGQS